MKDKNQKIPPHIVNENMITKTTEKSDTFTDLLLKTLLTVDVIKYWKYKLVSSFLLLTTVKKPLTPTNEITVLSGRGPLEQQLIFSTVHLR